MAVQTNTRKADKIAVGQAFADKLKENLPKANAERLTEEIKKLESKMSLIYSGEYGKYPKIANKSFYYFTEGNFYIVDPARFECPNSGDVPGRVEEIPTTYFNYDQFTYLYNHHNSCPIYSGYDNNGNKMIKNKNGNIHINVLVYHYSNSSGYPYHSYYIYNNGINFGYYDNWSSQSSVHTNALRLPISTVTGFKNAITYNLMPVDLDENEKKLFALLVAYNAKGWLTWNGNNAELSDDFFNSLKRNIVDDFGDICFKLESAAEYIRKGNTVHLVGEEYDNFVQHLVNVDNTRINLSPYEESRLTDPNGGHWDLWSVEAGENETLISLDSSFYGRNPVADVKYDGIVGIDFGTKSTIVTVQDGSDKILPMRIGSGDYTKDVSASDYENPTVMEFIDLDRFIKRYLSAESRPETEWIDLTISHTAAESLNAPKSGNEYYAWFSDLKQWASDKNRKIIIKDKKGKEIELSPFVDINDDDVNPIEYYAYLLGLFINNMYNGIYVNYLLSFPVTYERKIRNKIAVSFSNGLKKSLPKPVLDNQNAMSLFRVMEGVSEPAAYAVCALEEYGLKPAENEKILYGIFDFGGGTTDFDFGTWQRAPKKMQRRYDYVIKHFGAGGDRLLGGENLLELLAYSVFKNNEATLRKNEIQFIRPADAEKFCGSFDGGEALISDSQQAKINQKQLAEKLRPLWYGENFSQDKIKLNLYDTKENVSTIELAVNIDELNEIIRKRIDSGVENFFEAMNKAFTDDIIDDEYMIHIFLAGNSSKSSVVKESFEHFTNKYKDVFCKKFKIETEDSDNVTKDYFVKTYANKWKEILEEFGDSDIELSDEIPTDDSFIGKLSGRDYWKLLFNLCNYVDDCDELKKLLFELWKEGFMSVKQMAEIIDEAFSAGNFDEYDEYDEAISDFIYSNAETPADLRSKIESSGYKVHFEANIADLTTAELNRREETEVFKLYPPLGTEDADEIRRKMGIEFSTAITRPTGKTGVAYGLLECRPGSRIKVESEINYTDEIKFNFYLGYATFGKFEVVSDRDIEYGKWIEFIDASESDFELYYTDLPEATRGQMSINGVSKKICRIDETMDDAMVYIRAVEPSVIEYCAALDEEDLKNQEYLSEPKRIILE